METGWAGRDALLEEGQGVMQQAGCRVDSPGSQLRACMRAPGPGIRGRPGRNAARARHPVRGSCPLTHMMGGGAPEGSTAGWGGVRWTSARGGRAWRSGVRGVGEAVTCRQRTTSPAFLWSHWRKASVRALCSLARSLWRSHPGLPIPDLHSVQCPVCTLLFPLARSLRRGHPGPSHSSPPSRAMRPRWAQRRRSAGARGTSSAARPWEAQRTRARASSAAQPRRAQAQRRHRAGAALAQRRHSAGACGTSSAARPRWAQAQRRRSAGTALAQLVPAPRQR